MSDQLIFFGIIFIFIGILLLMLGSLSGENGKVEFGVGGFIGPVPFGWASSPRMLKWVMIISIAVMVGYITLILLKIL